MAKLFLKNIFFNIKMCPKAQMKFAIKGSKFSRSRIPNNPSKYCPRLLFLAKVSKFRQIALPVGCLQQRVYPFRGWKAPF